MRSWISLKAADWSVIVPSGFFSLVLRSVLWCLAQASPVQQQRFVFYGNKSETEINVWVFAVFVCLQAAGCGLNPLNRCMTGLPSSLLSGTLKCRLTQAAVQRQRPLVWILSDLLLTPTFSCGHTLLTHSSSDSCDSLHDVSFTLSRRSSEKYIYSSKCQLLRKSEAALPSS